MAIFDFIVPYFNGPTELVTGVQAVNDNAAALKMIRDSVGPQVAQSGANITARMRRSMNRDASVSASDIVLSQVKSLANQPALYKAMLERRRKLLEDVSSRIVVEGRNLDIVTAPIRDSHGLTRLDYAIRMHNPSDLTLTDGGDSRYTFALEVRVRVFGADGKSHFYSTEEVVRFHG